MSSHHDTKPDPFIRHLEATSNKLRSWPEWKRNMIGPALPEDKGRNSVGSSSSSIKKKK